MEVTVVKNFKEEINALLSDKRRGESEDHYDFRQLAIFATDLVVDRKFCESNEINWIDNVKYTIDKLWNKEFVILNRYGRIVIDPIAKVLYHSKDDVMDVYTVKNGKIISLNYKK